MTAVMEVWSPATLVLSTGRTGLCGFVPDGTPKTVAELEARRCRQPTAYLVTSKHVSYQGMTWEVCVDHAADARQMEWLGTIRTAPAQHRFSCRYGFAPCRCT